MEYLEIDWSTSLVNNTVSVMYNYCITNIFLSITQINYPMRETWIQLTNETLDLKVPTLFLHS